MPPGNKKPLSRIVLAVFFIAAGAGHFWDPEFYLQIMPPYIPFHRFMVFLSGALEMAFGAMVLFESTRRPAAWGLLLLLLAVLPANAHIALHPEIFPRIPSWVAWGRLPFQGLFMFWVYAAALKENRPPQG
ncbi:MAG TPA: MauE/DoxX family redox-associated membrane protein [Verrucomicrobiae bacterium]|jgi:uncharacterized membrane protein|nr:MauE/DoxX family redox-associated membrane protein [Verrucomicrobiae bacterium]